MNDATALDMLASAEASPIPSCNFPVGARDHRCKYWCKIVRRGATLPLPSSVDGAGDIPGAYLKKGDVEVFPGDVIFEGEENHHRKQRGWTWTMYVVDELGELQTVDYSHAKDILRMWGIKDVLPGAGAPAAMVRAAWYLRLAALAEAKREAPALHWESQRASDLADIEPVLA